MTIGLRWLLLRDGLGATNHMEATGFIRSDRGIEYPDIQYHFVPLAISYGDYCTCYSSFIIYFYYPDNQYHLVTLAISYGDFFTFYFIVYFYYPDIQYHFVPLGSSIYMYNNDIGNKFLKYKGTLTSNNNN